MRLITISILLLTSKTAVFAQNDVWNSLLTGHSDFIVSSAVSPDARLIVTEALDETAKLRDISNGKLLHNFKGYFTYPNRNTLEFSPDGKLLVTAGNNTPLVWDILTGSVAYKLVGHKKDVADVSFSSNGQLIATASDDGIGKIWSVKDGACLVNLVGHSRGLLSITFGPDGEKVLTSSWDRTVKIWDASSGKVKKTLNKHTNKIVSAVFSPNGELVLTSDQDGKTYIWNAKSGKLKYSFESYHDVRAADFSPDGQYIIVSAVDYDLGRSTSIYHSSSGKLFRSFDKAFIVGDRKVFGLDGKSLLLLYDLDLVLWDLEKNNLIKKVGNDYSSASSYFSSDRTKIIAESINLDQVEIYDARTGDLISRAF